MKHVSEREWGNNKRLTPKTVDRAILEHVQRLASRDGKKVPDDIVAFMESADVVFLDADNNVVTFDRVVVAWED